MIQHTFERYEKKFLLSGAQYRQLMAAASGRIHADEYGKTTVLSVYLDTPDRRLIRASLDKPAYKEKLRVRSYGVPTAADTVFVELKKKYRGMVYKRRVSLPLREARAWLLEGRYAPGGQIDREIDYVLHYYPSLAPAMLISAERVAYVGMDDPFLRLTFDSRILYRREALLLEAGAWGEELLAPGQRLLEIKTPTAIPLWLAGALDDCRAYPTSFSKYGGAYCSGRLAEREGVACV